MATVPTPHTWTAGDDATSSNMQTLTDSSNYGLGRVTSTGAKRPLAILRQTVAQSHGTSGSWFAVTFDAEDVDYDAGHSTVTNTSRYTANTAGYYQVSGGVGFASNATGARGARWAVNGTALNGTESMLQPITGVATIVPARTTLVFLNATDYVELQMFQTSGAALNTTVTTSQQPSMHVLWVSN